MAIPTTTPVLEAPIEVASFPSGVGGILKLGITGGIGSGKSVVCRVFATLGIPVFNADDAAQYLLAGIRCDSDPI